MVIRPHVGDPAYDKDEFWLLNKTLYDLRQSPQNWYNLITKILTNMGITSSKHNPCLFYEIIYDGIPPTTPRHRIHLGIYVNGFDFFSESEKYESRFKQLLKEKYTTDFMVDADFFLGSSFK